MAPSLAFLLCCGFAAWLFREDMKWRRLESPALWIAGIYVAIAGSRSPTYWTNYLGLGEGSKSNVEGSPLNFLITTALMVAALVALRQRGLNWPSLIRGNKGFFLIYIFFAASILWAEFPLVSLRRLFKDFGCVVIALLLLTQRDPAAAIRTIYVRVSFLLFPFSVLFYKFFPELGRTYSVSGEPLFAGVCTFKNELGQVLLVFGIILLWDFLELSKQENSAVKRRQMIIHFGCLLMAVWLFLASGSMTSMVCLVLGLLLWWVGGRLARLNSSFQIVVSVLAGVMFLAVANAIFRPATVILEALGRDPTLTGRTDAWPVMMEAVKNPLLGTGYRMFWDIHGLEVQEKTGFPYPSAHSGYVETYLAGGMIGVGLLGLLLLGIGLKIAKGLLEKGSFGRLGFIFWVLLLIYNWTESSFLWSTIIWFTFLLWAIKPRREFSSAAVLPSLSPGGSCHLAEHPNRIAL
jgi:exopolysaccharide production protein ExoQ